MNGQDIKKYALQHTGMRQMPDDYVIQYINKAMKELALMYDTACKKDYVIVETEGNEWEYMGNIIAIRRVYMQPTNSPENAPFDIESYNFLYENDRIKFDRKGRYKVEVIEEQDELEKIDNTPAINSLFHLAITYYVAYEEMARVFMHEDTNKDFLLAKFRENAQLANNRLVFGKRTKKIMACKEMI